MEPLAFLYDENNDGGYGGAISGMGMSDAGNQVAFNKLIDNTSSNDYIAASGYLQYEPIKGLIVKFNASRNMYFGKSRRFRNLPTRLERPNGIRWLVCLNHVRRLPTICWN